MLLGPHSLVSCSSFIQRAISSSQMQTELMVSSEVVCPFRKALCLGSCTLKPDKKVGSRGPSVKGLSEFKCTELWKTSLSLSRETWLFLLAFVVVSPLYRAWWGVWVQGPVPAVWTSVRGSAES